jgi:adenylate cyclase
MILLLLPAFLSIFSGGLISFLYTRDTMLKQWNESAILKLQRADHILDMRIAKPINMVDLFYQTNPVGDVRQSQKKLIQRIAGLESMVRVGFTYSNLNEDMKTTPPLKMDKNNKMPMHFHCSMLLNMSESQYDTDAGEETVKMVLSLLSPSNKVVRNLKITINFRFLLKDTYNLGWWQSDRACIVINSGRYIVHTNMSMKGRKSLGDTRESFKSKVLNELINKPFGTVTSKGHPPETIDGFTNWTLHLGPLFFLPGVTGYSSRSSSTGMLFRRKLSDYYYHSILNPVSSRQDCR